MYMYIDFHEQKSFHQDIEGYAASNIVRILKWGQVQQL